ncbi:hypothetical protein [Paenibacillus yanchengensis]|uniref:Uncharacterized protein n=1 Tax=Paenibacillus yanchengensis TaxID=2035833 RepID=A0ABW4YG80_9BACL
MVSAFTLSISNMNQYDKNYGYLYDVKGYKDWSTGEEIGTFYIKKVGPFWSVSSVGSAP